MSMVRIVLCAIALSLAACGGGGGGSGSSSSSSSSSGGPRGGYIGLSSSTASIHVSRFGPQTPARITISVTNSSVAAIGAAFPANQAPNWLLVAIEGGGTSYTLVLDPVVSLMQSGTSTATVIVGAADSSGRVLESHEVRISVDVFDGVHFGAGFNNTNATFGSDETIVYPLGLTANGTQSYTLTSDVPWATLPTGPRQGSASVPVSIDTTTLPIGVQTARITAANPADPADRHSTAIFIDVGAPSLQVTPSPIYVGGEDGVGPLSANVTVSLNTGARAYPWTAQFVNLPIAAAMSPPASGTVSGASPANFSVTGNAQQIAAGSYSGRLRIETTVKGLLFAREVDLTVNRETQRLFPLYDGVALSSFPGSSMLSRSIVVNDSHGRLGVPWSAVASVPWLQVTPANGVTGESVTITANPAALAADQFHAATVTLSSSDTQVERSETIRVGLWKGSADPIDRSVPLPVTTRAIVANPVEPWVYTLTNDGMVHVYNQFTGASLADYFAGVGTGSTMAVSSDGRLLYVADGQTPRIFEIDAATGVRAREFPVPSGSRLIGVSGTSVIAAVRLNAHPVLFQPYAGGSEVIRPIDLETGQPLRSYTVTGSQINSDILSIYDDWQVPSADGAWLYNGSRNGIESSRRTFSMLSGTRLTYVPGQYYTRLSEFTDLCAGVDGRVNFVTGVHSEIQVHEQNLFPSTSGPITLPALGNGVACGWDGRRYATMSAATTTAPNLFVIDGAGSTLTARIGSTAAVYPLTLVLSGDGRRLIWKSLSAGSDSLMFANAP